MFKTLRFQLTLSHAGIFGCLALLVFGFAYLTVSKQLLVAIEKDLQDTATEFSDLYQTKGMPELQAEIDRETVSHGKDNFAALYLDASGKMVINNVPASWKFPLPKPKVEIRKAQWLDASVNDRGDEAKFIATPTINNGWLLLGLSLREYDAQMRNIRAAFGWMLLVIVLAGIGTGWWQVRRALAGVDQVRKAAIEIGEGAFDQRLELKGHGQELIDLAEAFNIMLDRIQKLIGEMRDVSDNIAHDLRTPIARIRGMAESSLMASNADETSNEVMSSIIGECDRLATMINTMLEIAQTNSGAVKLEPEPVDVAHLLEDACDLFEPVAEEAKMTLKLNISDERLMVLGDKTKLQRLVANLLDNAIKFSSPGGRILLFASNHGSVIHFCVNDKGLGIAEADMPHVFERFYRSDKSRHTSGNGLGLSYAKSIVEAHGGSIRIESKFRHGTKVTVILPAA